MAGKSSAKEQQAVWLEGFFTGYVFTRVFAQSKPVLVARRFHRMTVTRDFRTVKTHFGWNSFSQAGATALAVACAAAHCSTTQPQLRGARRSSSSTRLTERFACAMKQMQQLHAAAALHGRPRLPSFPAIAAPQQRPCARALCVGLPSRDEALRAQRRNLERFVQEQSALFDQLPFHPWTDNRKKPRVKTTVGLSMLPGCHGLRGVHLAEDVMVGYNEVALLFYPGLLMTDAMFELFNSKYYCPTALELPALGFVDASGIKQKMLIVGDPTSHGAIINDGVRSGKARKLKASQRIGL